MMTMRKGGSKQERYDLLTRHLSDISKASSLMEIFDLHKRLWNDGIRHRNIGPDEYGMFRTDDISRMSPSQVYLGNVYGLWTAPLPQWIGTPDERIITEQYRQHLMSNLEWLRSQIFDNGIDRLKVEKAIAADAPDWAGITHVRISDKEMRDDRLMEFTYNANGVSGRSNVILIPVSMKTDLLLVPRNWYRGEHVGSSFKVDKIGQWKDLSYKDRMFSVKKELFGKGFSLKQIPSESQKEQNTPKLKK